MCSPTSSNACPASRQFLDLLIVLRNILCAESRHGWLPLAASEGARELVGSVACLLAEWVLEAAAKSVAQTLPELFDVLLV